MNCIVEEGGGRVKQAQEEKGKKRERENAKRNGAEKEGGTLEVSTDSRKCCTHKKAWCWLSNKNCAV